LFGIKNTNRDFLNPQTWGKNQFNNTFPVALTCYLASKNLEPVYITLTNKLAVKHGGISVEDIFGIAPSSENLFFGFEYEFKPYNSFVKGKLPRVDVVTINKSRDEYLRPLEVKFTALPDDQTSDLPEDEFGSEIVVRPDTIVYLALSLADAYKDNRKELLAFLDPVFRKKVDWTKSKQVAPLVPLIAESIDKVLLKNLSSQKPLVLQPIWKTNGKTGGLAKYCLDVFVWSDFAFTRPFLDIAKQKIRKEEVDRPHRAVVWLGSMLYEFAKNGKMNHQAIIDSMTYDRKNDKAFSVGGKYTHPYMKSPELLKPRITKEEVNKIILGGGQKYLSPERRFDAVIQSASDIFTRIEDES